MKPIRPFLCLLLSVSALGILPVVSEIVTNNPTKTKEELAAQRQAACYAAIQSEILDKLNPTISIRDRFSRVMTPLPEKYYAHKIVSETEDGIIHFEIIHINRIAAKPTTTVVATGTFDSSKGSLLLKEEENGKYVTSAQHSLTKKPDNT